MGIEAYCPTCQRALYVGDDDHEFCPVCSSPLIEAINDGEQGSVQPQNA